MSIESRIPAEEINITDLSIEKEDREFDPVRFYESEIVEKNRDFIYSELSRLEKEPDYQDIATIAGHLKLILNESEFEQIKATYFDRMHLESKLLEHYEQVDDAHKYEYCAALRALYPDTYEEKIGRDNGVDLLMKKIPLSARKTDWYLNLSYGAELQTFLNTGKFNIPFEEILNITQHETIIKGRKNNWDLNTSEDPRIYITIILEELSNFKIIYPKEFNESKVLSAEDIRLILENTKKLYDKSRPDVVSMCFQMAAAKILLAEDVIRQPYGLHLTMPQESLEITKPRLPEIKKF